MISDVSLDRIKELPIETIIEPYVKLKKDGAHNMKGLCPFHSESTPSFKVNLSKNYYHCFGCNRGGDGIKFIMEIEKLSFTDAVRYIAKQHNIELVETDDKEQSEKNKIEQDHKESLFVVLEHLQDFYSENLRLTATDESRNARAYAYSRWDEEFCAQVGIGYAPRNSKLFMDFCQTTGLEEKFLIELGMLRKNEDGSYFPMFRERIMIPIKNKWGRVIAYTARYIGTNEKAPKYLNSSTSPIYSKGESLFGVDQAFHSRNAENILIVEGAPDVLRLQSIGLDNAVATLGTAWNENQFDQLKRVTNSLCFIPDTDVPKTDELGAGFKAVIENGTLAIKKGFDVTVKELPFNTRKMTDEELAQKYEGQEIPQNAPREVFVKSDPDNFILDKDIFKCLEEKNFIVWMTEKKFSLAGSMAKRKTCVNETANLLRFVKDQLTFNECIEQLAKVHGKAKMWRDAFNLASEESKKNSKQALIEQQQEEADTLRQHGLFIRSYCYYSLGKEDEDPSRISNFIMEPLFHIKDETNGIRLFRLTNSFRQPCIIELKESDMCSLSSFQQKIGSCGNYVWLGKIEMLNRIKECLYSRTDSAERIRRLGWNENEQFFAFGNGIFQFDTFYEVDDMGILRDCNNKAYYIPATSKFYCSNDEIYQFERQMVHRNKSGVLLPDFVSKLMEVFGKYGSIAFGYLLSTLFRDIIYKRCRHFPILNLFGEKGTGKTTLATSLEAFFLHDVEPPSMGVASVPAMNDRVSQAVNTLVVFDEYKNDLDVRKIAFLKGLWGGSGQTKKNTTSDGMATQTIATTGVIICGQEKPTQDMALYTRVIFLAYSKTSFSILEKRRYEELQAICNTGLTHLTIEILKHRELFEKNFPDLYKATKNELGQITEGEGIHDRIFGNWIIPLATFRTLESVLHLPFGYAQMLETTLEGMRSQNELAQESSEVADFWSALQGWQTIGKCVEKVHYNIRYLTKFRPLNVKEDVEFLEAKPILYLNMAAIASLYSSRNSGQSTTANRSTWSTITSYLKSHPSFMGLKQDRFRIMLPSGNLDYTIEVKDGKTFKNLKINRPKAMCFDYSILKEMFGLDLESEVIAEGMDDIEE